MICNKKLVKILFNCFVTISCNIGCLVFQYLTIVISRPRKAIMISFPSVSDCGRGDTDTPDESQYTDSTGIDLESSSYSSTSVLLADPHYLWSSEPDPDSFTNWLEQKKCKINKIKHYFITLFYDYDPH